MVVTPAVRTSRWSLPGAVPGALVTPGASKPGELLLHYFVELPLRGDGHGGNFRGPSGRQRQARCRCGSRRKQYFSSATIGKRRQALGLHREGVLGLHWQALAWTCIMARGQVSVRCNHTRRDSVDTSQGSTVHLPSFSRFHVNPASLRITGAKLVRVREQQIP